MFLANKQINVFKDRSDIFIESYNISSFILNVHDFVCYFLHMESTLENIFIVHNMLVTISVCNCYVNMYFKTLSLI